MLGKEQILAADDIGKIEMEVPEWGGSLIVRALTGAERGEFERRTAEQAKAGRLAEHYRALVVIASVADAEGRRLFSYDDLEAVSAKAGRVLDRIAENADRLNKLSDAEIEALAKN